MRVGSLLFSLISALLLSCATLRAEPATVEIRPHFRLKKLTGFTSPREEMMVISEVNGRCISIAVNIGTAIPENGKIAEIDRTFIELELEANRIAQDQVRRQLAEEEKSLRRYSKLLSEKSTPQARLDEVALAADLHRLELRSLVNTNQRLSEQLKRHTITAPPGWRVIERYAEPGEYLQVGSAVARLGDFRSLLISLAFSSEELKQIQALPALSVNLPEIDTTLPASIYRISPVLDPATRKIMVDLIVESNGQTAAGALRGGMRVEFGFSDKTQAGVFEIPASAVISQYEASWIVRPDGARIRVIRLGTSTANNTALITADILRSGQRYLLHPEQTATQ